jgi:hypothetical protein
VRILLLGPWTPLLFQGAERGSTAPFLYFADLSDHVRLPGGRTARLGGEERVAGLALHGAEHLREFRLELGLPVWTFEVDGAVVEKRLLLCHGQNTLHVAYRPLSGPEVRLTLRPGVHLRGVARISSPSPHGGAGGRGGLASRRGGGRGRGRGRGPLRLRAACGGATLRVSGRRGRGPGRGLPGS